MIRCRESSWLWRCTRTPGHAPPCALMRPWSKRWMKWVYVQ